jgi:cytoskeletal protein CcmA (bactofilin family)
MFHRPNTKPETEPVSLNTAIPGKDNSAELSPAAIYAKTEKEKSMYPNQSSNAAPATESSEGETNRPIDIPGSPAGLQRPMQPARPMPGVFPGSYSPASTSSYGAVPGAKTEGRRLVVGEGISLSGEIEACDVLIVEGTIEAALKGAKTLDIAETGVFYGTVSIDEATVAGRFEGDLTVQGRLTIKSTGSITGSVSYKELAVEAGAVLDGKVVPLSGSRAEKKPEGRSAQPKKVVSRDTGAELPFAMTNSV